MTKARFSVLKGCDVKRTKKILGYQLLSFPTNWTVEISGQWFFIRKLDLMGLSLMMQI